MNTAQIYTFFSNTSRKLSFSYLLWIYLSYFLFGGDLNQTLLIILSVIFDLSSFLNDVLIEKMRLFTLWRSR